MEVSEKLDRIIFTEFALFERHMVGKRTGQHQEVVSVRTNLIPVIDSLPQEQLFIVAPLQLTQSSIIERLSSHAGRFARGHILGSDHCYVNDQLEFGHAVRWAIKEWMKKGLLPVPPSLTIVVGNRKEMDQLQFLRSLSHKIKVVQADLFKAHEIEQLGKETPASEVPKQHAIEELRDFHRNDHVVITVDALYNFHGARERELKHEAIEAIDDFLAAGLHVKIVLGGGKTSTDSIARIESSHVIQDLEHRNPSVPWHKINFSTIHPVDNSGYQDLKEMISTLSPGHEQSVLVITSPGKAFIVDGLKNTYTHLNVLDVKPDHDFPHTDKVGDSIHMIDLRPTRNQTSSVTSATPSVGMVRAPK